jgi:hypothetical protein
METTQKIKTNHTFTKAQLISLNKELQKISNNEIVALKGTKFSPKKNYIDIDILKTPFLLDVFLSFVDVSDGTSPKFEMYKIDAAGVVDYEPKKNMIFNSFADRISFFNQLEKIEFN